MYPLLIIGHHHGAAFTVHRGSTLKANSVILLERAHRWQQRCGLRRRALETRGGGDCTYSRDGNSDRDSEHTAHPGPPASNSRLAALTVVYSAIIASKTALPVTLEILIRSGGVGAGIEKLPYRSTLAIVAGKLTLGPLTDAVGPKKFLAAVLLCMGMSLVACGTTTNGGIFCIAWCTLNFAFGGAWGGITAAIREDEPRAWGAQLAACGLASRLSVLLAAAAFGRMMSLGAPWRAVFFVAATLALASMFVLLGWKTPTAYDDGPPAPENGYDGTESLERAYWRFFHSPTFWALLLARAFHMVVSSFIGFVPLFLGTAFFAKSAAVGANTAGHLMRISGQLATNGTIAWAAGGILATSWIASLYRSASSRGKEATVVQSGFVTATATLVLFAHCSRSTLGPSRWLLGNQGLNPSGLVTAALLFVIGAGNALPFYVTINELMLSLAGQRHTATLANILDAAGFALTIPFEALAGQCGRAAAAHSKGISVSSTAAAAAAACWTPIAALLQASSLFGVIALYAAMRLDRGNSHKSTRK